MKIISKKEDGDGEGAVWEEKLYADQTDSITKFYVFSKLTILAMLSKLLI